MSVRARVLWTAAALAVAACRKEGPGPLECHAGAYRLASGEVVVVTPSEGTDLRYRLADGRSGRLRPAADGALVAGPDWSSAEPVAVRVRFGACDAGTIAFEHEDGPKGEGRRIPLRVRDLGFERAGTRFHGRLLLPEGGAETVTILAHGSERDAATRFYALQYLLPAQGIGAYVYDKRGTGRSGGDYTQDFHVLADDLVAAVAAVREALRPAAPRVGLLGGSQGGWIAPLAATRTPVDLVVVTYGMAEGPLAEDREEVLSELRAMGYGDDVLAKGREVTRATGAVMASRFRSGFEELDRVKEAYGKEPWFEKIRGEFTGDLLEWPGWILRIAGPFHDVGTTWDHDAEGTLARVTAPMLWVVGGRDREAPSGTTVEILRRLQEGPSRLDLAVFPGADHGILEFEEKDGARRTLRHSPGYFELLADWISTGGLHGPYGDAVIHADASAPAP